MLQISMVTTVAQSVIMPVAVPMGYTSSLAAPMFFKNTKNRAGGRERDRGGCMPNLFSVGLVTVLTQPRLYQAANGPTEGGRVEMIQT